MMEEENYNYKIFTKDGKFIDVEVLLAFTSKTYGKDYILYTDNTLDDEGNTKIYASEIESKGDNSILLGVESEEEQEYLNGIMLDYIASLEQ